MYFCYKNKPNKTSSYLHSFRLIMCISIFFRYVEEVTDALYERRNEFIRFPVGQEANRESHGFQRIVGFPNVVGLIDGTHVRIQAPTENEDSYENRKGYHSINAQIVVGNNSIITDVYAEWPGRLHDSRIFRNSPLLEKFMAGEYRGILLGDSGYACSNIVLTPKGAELNDKDRRYNASHKRCRCGVERAYGQLKRRFQCLHCELRLEPGKVCKVIVACCILHNLAKRWNTPLPPPNDDIPPLEQPPPDEERDGHQITLRDIIINRYF